MSTFNQVKSILSEITSNERKRILSTTKQFIVCDVSVCNAGVVVIVKCTDNYYRYQNISNDGYSFILESDDIKNILS